MPNQDGSIKKAKVRKKGTIYGPLSFVIICAAMIFGMSVFFRISEIEVTGANIYTPEEIIEASGVQERDNLFFINRSAAVARVLKRLPYVDSVRVNRRLPNKLSLDVTESVAIGYFLMEHDAWIVDNTGKFLGKVGTQEVKNLIRIEGVEILTPKIGAVLETEITENPKALYLIEILKAASEYGVTSHISYIDMSNIANPSLDFQERFTVKLGRRENTDYKFGILIDGITQLEEDATGVIDLSIDAKAHFIPES